MLCTNGMVATILLFGFCLCQPVLGQSDADLRRDNERLRAENEDLQRELDAARQRIADLEQRLEQLRRQLADVPSDGPVEGEDEEQLEPVSVDVSDPAASPRSLMNALVARFEEALGELEVGTPGSAERSEFLRALREWRERMHRDHRRILVDWHVRVLEASPVGREQQLRLIVVDPENGAHIGFPFMVRLPRALARRYELLASHMEGDVFVLRSIMTPNIIINESRTAAGPFDNPPFIGTFAEFGFNLDVRSIERPAEDPE